MNQARIQVVDHRLGRAQEALGEARLLADGERWNACVSRLYYACFYAVSALLLGRNLSSSKHSGVRSLFNLHFVKRGTVSRELGALYNDLFENRQKGDYMDFVSFGGDQVRPWISQAEAFVKEIAALVAADAASIGEEQVAAQPEGPEEAAGIEDTEPAAESPDDTTADPSPATERE